MPTSTSASFEPANPVSEAIAFPAETEIYLLPDGRVIVADLPTELTALVEQLGEAEACEIAPSASETSDAPGVDPWPRL